MEGGFHHALPSTNSFEINSSEKRCGNDGVPNDNNGNSHANLKADVLNITETSNDLEKERPICDGASLVLSETSSLDSTQPRGSKRLHDDEELDIDNKKCRTVILDSEDDTHAEENKSATSLKNGGPSVGGNLFPSQSLKEKFHCTACNAVAVDVRPHPLLKVIICRDCKYLLKAKMHLKV